MENNLHFFFFFNIVGKQQSRLRPLVDAVKKELAYMWNASGSEISKFQPNFPFFFSFFFRILF